MRPHFNTGGSGSIVKREPATVISVVTGLITAIIGLLVAFGIDVSQEQQTAIISVVVALSAVIALVGPIIRQFVYSPNSVETIANQQYEAGAPPVEPQPPLPPPAEARHPLRPDHFEVPPEEWGKHNPRAGE